jgi:hypothetical protein
MGLILTFAKCEPTAFRVGQLVHLQGNFRIKTEKPRNWAQLDVDARSEWLDSNHTYELHVVPESRRRIFPEVKQQAEITDGYVKQKVRRSTYQRIHAHSTNADELWVNLKANRDIERRLFAGVVTNSFATNGRDVGIAIELATDQDATKMRIRNSLIYGSPYNLYLLSMLGLICSGSMFFADGLRTLSLMTAAVAAVGAFAGWLFDRRWSA